LGFLGPAVVGLVTRVVAQVAATTGETARTVGTAPRQGGGDGVSAPDYRLGLESGVGPGRGHLGQAVQVVLQPDREDRVELVVAGGAQLQTAVGVMEPRHHCPSGTAVLVPSDVGLARAPSVVVDALLAEPTLPGVLATADLEHPVRPGRDLKALVDTRLACLERAPEGRDGDTGVPLPQAHPQRLVAEDPMT